KNESASNGSPAEIEYAVAIQPMMAGEIEPAAAPNVKAAPTAVPRICVGNNSVVYPSPAPKLPVIRKLATRPTQNRLIGSLSWPMTTSKIAAGTTNAGMTKRRRNWSDSQPQNQ